MDIWDVALSVHLSLSSSAALLLREKEKAAATKLEADIWLSASLVLDGCSYF